MKLLDSNILIYAAESGQEVLRERILNQIDVHLVLSTPVTGRKDFMQFLP